MSDTTVLYRKEMGPGLFAEYVYLAGPQPLHEIATEEARRAEYYARAAYDGDDLKYGPIYAGERAFRRAMCPHATFGEILDAADAADISSFPARTAAMNAARNVKAAEEARIRAEEEARAQEEETGGGWL